MSPLKDIMLRYLFPRLTPRPPRGSALFEALVGEARQPHWYLVGKIPDTLEGRFAVLATIVALTTVRLEHGGEAARESAVALAERFVEAMDAEHRQMGIGDPALGKIVRKLVASLGRRVERWREAVRDGERWAETVTDSLFQGAATAPDPADYCGQHLRLFWTRLAGMSGEQLAQGRLQ